MNEISYFFDLNPEWMGEFASQIGTEVINNELIVFPEKIGDGSIYFMPVNTYISVLFIDVLLHTPVLVRRKGCDNGLLVFHFDLSENFNLIKIKNVDHQIGANDKLDLAIIDNKIESSYVPSIERRTFAIRMLVGKRMLKNFAAYYSAEIEKIDSIAFNGNREGFYHYGNLDLDSTLLMKSLHNKEVNDPSFNIYLKGVSLKLLGNFLSRFYQKENNFDLLTDKQEKAISKTREYMVKHLREAFPSMPFLANMANMSISKYKTAFYANFSMSAHLFFVSEKMKLSRILLKSGNYSFISEIVRELNFSSQKNFSRKYLAFFKVKASDDLKKKVEEGEKL